jgi:hypothetical protein
MMEQLGNFGKLHQTPRCNNPEDGHLQVRIKFLNLVLRIDFIFVTKIIKRNVSLVYIINKS